MPILYVFLFILILELWSILNSIGTVTKKLESIDTHLRSAEQEHICTKYANYSDADLSAFGAMLATKMNDKSLPESKRLEVERILSEVREAERRRT